MLDLVRLVLFFGILTGFAEVILVAVIKFASLASAPAGWASPDVRLRHSYVWLSPHIIWMAPLTLSVCLAFPAALLAFAGRVSRGILSIRNASVVLAFFCCLSLLNIYPRLYIVAVLVLGAGLAVQLGRLADARRTQFLGLVRRTTRWLVGALLLLAVTMNIGGVLRERMRVAALAASLDGVPNVLLLILDTVRASNMSLYGYSRETTPRLERLAADGVTFDMAIATSPWTLPSHVSMFTGRLPYEFTSNFLIPYGGEHTTLAEFFTERGYVTAGFVGNLVYCTEESGITTGFTHYEDHKMEPSEFVKSFALGRRLEQNPLLHRLLSHYDVFGDKDAAEVTDEFLSWVDNRPDNRPFFAFLNYMDAHEPYLPPERFQQQFGSGWERSNDLNTYFIRWAARAGRAQMRTEELAAEVAAYDGTIAYVDEQIGILLDKLREDGLLQKTVVVVVSDHGEQFGEHGLHVHGNSLYLPNLHVPLLVAYGNNLPAGGRVATPVSIRDIPATVMSLTSLSGGAPFPGRSLERFWEPVEEDSERVVEPVFSELTDIRGAPTTKSLVVGRYHYIWGENRTEALFDLQSDPGELTSILTPENLELVNSMRRMIAPHIRNDAALWERLPQNE
jgi:arylsulfatase A-like enzyme